MGFQVPKLLKLKFDEGDYAGAEIGCRMNVPSQLLLDIGAIGEAFERNDGAAIDDLSRQFAEEVLHSWNLEDEDGQPVTPSADEFMDLPLPLRVSVLQSWASKVADIPDPLGRRSKPITGDVPPAPASIPMEVLS